MSKTKTPSLPPVPNDVPPAHRRFFEALKESIEVWDGHRGNALDRVLTVRELVDSGMATIKRNASGLLSGGGVDFEGVANLDYSVPPPLTNLTAAGAFSSIFVSWDQVAYSNLSHVEIWRAAADDLGQAALVGSTSANVFMDYVGGSSTYFYWVRPVTTANITGPYNDTAGTQAATNDDPAYLLEVLQGSVAESQLSQDLNSRIDLVDAGIDTPGSVSARIKAEEDARATADGAIASSVTTLQTTVGSNTAAIQQQAESIDGINAQYTVKIDVNGYVAGFGLAVESANATQSSLFLVNADRFAIGHPGASSDITPFIVDNGKVYMDMAVIKDASISNAKIGSISAEKINAGIINVALTLNAATINGGSLNINNKFKVDSQGNATIRSGTSGARLELVNNVIRVYDASGVLRVKIGNLA